MNTKRAIKTKGAKASKKGVKAVVKKSVSKPAKKVALTSLPAWADKITILYEDSACLVINKPAGVVVHPDGKSEGPFLTDWILAKYPKVKGVGEPTEIKDGGVIDRPGIVHRLDKDTSGGLLIAKTQPAYEALKKQFQDRTIKKKYLAFIYGKLNDPYGIIDLPIGRSPRDFREYSAGRGARGIMREAVTHYVVLASRNDATNNDGRNKSPEIESNCTFIEAEPKTGRTHQIRVHFKAIQHPIVGDALYAPNKPLFYGFKRMALHAYTLSFTSPADPSSKQISITAPLPEDFKFAMKEMGVNPEITLDPEKLKRLP